MGMDKAERIREEKSKAEQCRAEKRKEVKRREECFNLEVIFLTSEIRETEIPSAAKSQSNKRAHGNEVKQVIIEIDGQTGQMDDT